MVRFVDDGTGGWMGNLNDFKTWVTSLNTHLIAGYGLEITHKIKPYDQYIEFLDIKYEFDNQGLPKTDLYIKPTDCHRSLNYSSFHPRHVFRSVVYCQALRYKRIISDTHLLTIRLKTL